MRSPRFALRVLQNRAGLVPRPSWCTYRVRSPSAEGPPPMPVATARSVFEQLGQLDVVRLAGDEPLERVDLDELAEVILEVSRPGVLQLDTDGRDPVRAEDFARGLSRARGLRIFVRVPPVPDREAPLGAHRRFVLALETVKRLRAVARDRGFALGGRFDLEPGVGRAELERLQESFEGLGVDLHVVPPATGPDASAEGPNAGATDLRATLALRRDELARGEPSWAREVERYLVEGALSRVRGDASPRPRPRCTALRSHVRLEPDGRVLTCGHRPHVVGALAEEDFDRIWFGLRAETARAVVDRCSGCWDPDETLANALYSGDFVRSRRPRDRRHAAASALGGR
mgnify:CR=1 FL=1